MDAGLGGTATNTGRDERPVLFVMNAQEGMINPSFPDGTAQTHLQNTIEEIVAFTEKLRACGVRIVWLFHMQGPQAQDMAPFTQAQAPGLLRQSLKGADAPLHSLPIRADDLICIRKSLSHPNQLYWGGAAARLGMSRATPVAGCGFSFEEPCTDGVYLWAHEMRMEGFSPTIIEDLADNKVPAATTTVAAMNIRFLKKLKDGIDWVQSALWLREACVKAERVAALETGRRGPRDGFPASNVLPLHPGLRSPMAGGTVGKKTRSCGCGPDTMAA